MHLHNKPAKTICSMQTHPHENSVDRMSTQHVCGFSRDFITLWWSPSSTCSCQRESQPDPERLNMMFDISFFFCESICRPQKVWCSTSCLDIITATNSVERCLIVVVRLLCVYYSHTPILAITLPNHTETQRLRMCGRLLISDKNRHSSPLYIDN